MENGNTAPDTATEQNANDYFGYAPIAEDTTQVDPANTEDYQAKVNELLKATKVTKEGKFEFPDGTDEWAKKAVMNEKKFRDTQSGFTQATQSNKLLEAEVKVLKDKLAGKTALTQEQTEELDELKVMDVDAYFAKRTEYEASAQTQFDVELADVRTKTESELEIERREQFVTDFNVGRDKPITQELIDNEVPAKFFKQLQANEVTFDEFMSNVAKYVDTPKVAGEKATDENVTNLSNVAGGTTPSAEKRYNSLEEDYADLTF